VVSIASFKVGGSGGVPRYAQDGEMETCSGGGFAYPNRRNGRMTYQNGPDYFVEELSE
jgi:hypothetical protein